MPVIKHYLTHTRGDIGAFEIWKIVSRVAVKGLRVVHFTLLLAEGNTNCSEFASAAPLCTFSVAVFIILEAGFHNIWPKHEVQLFPQSEASWCHFSPFVSALHSPYDCYLGVLFAREKLKETIRIYKLKWVLLNSEMHEQIIYWVLMSWLYRRQSHLVSLLILASKVSSQ